MHALRGEEFGLREDRRLAHSGPAGGRRRRCGGGRRWRCGGVAATASIVVVAAAIVAAIGLFKCRGRRGGPPLPRCRRWRWRWRRAGLDLCPGVANGARLRSQPLRGVPPLQGLKGRTGAAKITKIHRLKARMVNGVNPSAMLLLQGENQQAGARKRAPSFATPNGTATPQMAP